MKKRILSILLVLALCAAQLPLTASANNLGFLDNPNTPVDGVPPPPSQGSGSSASESQGSGSSASEYDPKADPNYDNGIRNVQGLSGLQASQKGTRLDFFEMNVCKILNALEAGETVTISMPKGTTIDTFALYRSGDIDLDVLADATGSLNFQFPDGSYITISASELAKVLTGMETGDKLAFSSSKPYVYILKPNNTKEAVDAGERTAAPPTTEATTTLIENVMNGENVVVQVNEYAELNLPGGADVSVLENAEGTFTVEYNNDLAVTMDNSAILSAVEQARPGDNVYIGMEKTDQDLPTGGEEAFDGAQVMAAFEVNVNLGPTYETSEEVVLHGELEYTVAVNTEDFGIEFSPAVAALFNGYKVHDDGTWEKKPVTVEPVGDSKEVIQPSGLQDELHVPTSLRVTIFSDSNSTYVLVYEPPTHSFA